MKGSIKRLIVAIVPLGLRKKLAIWLSRRSWGNADTRAWWCTELLTDFAADDANAYHKFLWTHHLAYARSYEIAERFGYDNFNQSRKILFEELPDRLSAIGLDPDADVDSVLDVGCSLGYLLRYVETDVFPGAGSLVGVDVDGHAIRDGSRYLQGIGSKVQLYDCDLETMTEVVGDQAFDVVLASGVLLYFDLASAERVVHQLVQRTRKLLIITGLAAPDCDNRELQASQVRERDGTWIHNIDAMLEGAGARILARRWEGGRIVDGNTIYFLYAGPADSQLAESVA